jgi:uncharacterized protein involved in tolerance to divalent cations
MQKYCRVLISATSKREADKISDTLIKKKLAAGTLILKGFSRYWWSEKVVEKIYFNISAFSLFKYKKEIISVVKKNHKDKCPIIAFFQMDGNDEFLMWIEDCLK